MAGSLWLGGGGAGGSPRVLLPPGRFDDTASSTACAAVVLWPAQCTDTKAGRPCEGLTLTAVKQTQHND